MTAHSWCDVVHMTRSDKASIDLVVPCSVKETHDVCNTQQRRQYSHFVPRWSEVSTEKAKNKSLEKEPEKKKKNRLRHIPCHHAIWRLRSLVRPKKMSIKRDTLVMWPLAV